MATRPILAGWVALEPGDRMTDAADITKAAQILRETAEPTRIILFGSYARGEPRGDSDVDILVVEREVPDRVAEMVRLTRALRPLRLPIDLLVVSDDDFHYWSDTPGNVYFEALREGRILYEAA